MNKEPAQDHHHTSPIVLGLDGGGTHSCAVVLDAHGSQLASAQSGSLNYLSSGVRNSRETLKELLECEEVA